MLGLLNTQPILWLIAMTEKMKIATDVMAFWQTFLAHLTVYGTTYY